MTCAQSPSVGSIFFCFGYLGQINCSICGKVLNAGICSPTTLSTVKRKKDRAVPLPLAVYERNPAVNKQNSRET